MSQPEGEQEEGGMAVLRLRSTFGKRARSGRALLHSKGATSSSRATTRNNSSVQNSLSIEVEDDDDDVRVSSPRSVAEAISSAVRRPRRSPAVARNDSKLSMAYGSAEASTARTKVSAQNVEGKSQGIFMGLSFDSPIDLTTSNDSPDVLVDANDKRVKGIQLMCAICMDNVKEEMSTVCGHIFCKKCITVAIQTQKKCPTCRRKLSSGSIHRIFISSNAK